MQSLRSTEEHERERERSKSERVEAAVKSVVQLNRSDFTLPSTRNIHPSVCPFSATIAHIYATSCEPGFKKAGPFAGHPVEEKCADTVPDGRLSKRVAT